MKVAVMQPYLFPYLGYFQLIREVDVFVVYDDVNFINRGWINRNNILAQGKEQRLTMELTGASQNKLINEIEVRGQNDKLLRSIDLNYRKSPNFSQVYPMIKDILNQREMNLARFLDYQLRQICSYLNLTTDFYTSSKLELDKSLRGQDKIIKICEKLGAKQYFNLPGGQKLYDQMSFHSRGIELIFVQPQLTIYSQYKNDFVPHLSIIDVMMFNSPQRIKEKLLPLYNLVRS